MNKHEACTVEAIRYEHHVRNCRRKTRFNRFHKKYEQTGKSDNESHPDLDKELMGCFSILVYEFGVTEHAVPLPLVGYF